MNKESLKEFDPIINTFVSWESDRIEEGINLIASESYPIPAVMEANGSVLVSKYSEGYPTKRYYGGCENVDNIETLAKSRVLHAFNAQNEYHVNVQPHAGSQANMAVYMACLELGDRVLAMDLNNGGHLTHGSGVNFSGKLYDFEHYGVDENGFIDYEIVREKALQHEPKLIVCGASAYSRAIDFRKFKQIADEVGALLLADISHIAGLVVAGLHMSPVGYADFITTTTHKTLLGTRGAIILCKRHWGKKIDSAVFPNMQGGALQHIIAGKAVSFEYAGTEEFLITQQNIVITASIMAEEFMRAGIPIVSGGTDNHMFLLDLEPLGISGKEAETALEKVGIYVNKNMTPRDKTTPFVTSGIRIGAVSITQRGFSYETCRLVTDCIVSVLKDPNNDELLQEVRQIVRVLAEEHPIYRWA